MAGTGPAMTNNLVVAEFRALHIGNIVSSFSQSE